MHRVARLVRCRPHPRRPVRGVHAAARSGFSGDFAAAYDGARPEYAPAAIEWLLGGVLQKEHISDATSDAHALRSITPSSVSSSSSSSSSSVSSSSASSSSPRHDILDLGAGSGKLSRAVLRARPGLRVVGVDPATEMCVAYGKALAEDNVTADVLQGTAEKIPLLDSSVGCVVAGQSFHWFASAAALREISRVLVPGGALGFVWNTRDTRVPWVQALEDVIAPFYSDSEGNDGGGGVPRQQSGEWRTFFDDAALEGMNRASDSNEENHSSRLFEPLESKTLSKADPMTEDELVDHVLSLSVIATQDGDVRSDVAARVRDILTNDPSVVQAEGEEGAENGSKIILPYVTELYVTASLKDETTADAMEEALHSRVDKIATSALHLDDFFGNDAGDDGEDDEDDEDFVDYTDDHTGEWNGPTRGGRRPEPTRHGDWHVMGRCTDF
jgi:SAM-dependent methyltransferase